MAEIPNELLEAVRLARKGERAARDELGEAEDRLNTATIACRDAEKALFSGVQSIAESWSKERETTAIHADGVQGWTIPAVEQPVITAAGKRADLALLRELTGFHALGARANGQGQFIIQAAGETGKLLELTFRLAATTVV